MGMRSSRRARPVRFCSGPASWAGVVEGEGAQGIDPLAAGEHEEGGAGHLGDVVAVADQGGCGRGGRDGGSTCPSLAATTR